MSGKISKIEIFLQKNQGENFVKNALCVVDCGLQGDRYAKGGEKQLTIIDQDTVQWLKNQSEDGLCFKKFKANITVENLDVSLLKSDDVLTSGDAEFTVSTAAKECYKECSLIQKSIYCPLRKHAKYLRVSQGGTIKTGDEISVKR